MAELEDARKLYVDAMIDADKARSAVKQIANDYQYLSNMIPSDGEGDNHYRAMSLLRIALGKD